MESLHAEEVVEQNFEVKREPLSIMIESGRYNHIHDDFEWLCAGTGGSFYEIP